jgi:hypothetical protein
MNHTFVFVSQQGLNVFATPKIVLLFDLRNVHFDWQATFRALWNYVTVINKGNACSVELTILTIICECPDTKPSGVTIPDRPLILCSDTNPLVSQPHSRRSLLRH